MNNKAVLNFENPPSTLIVLLELQLVDSRDKEMYYNPAITAELRPVIENIIAVYGENKGIDQKGGRVPSHVLKLRERYLAAKMDKPNSVCPLCACKTDELFCCAKHSNQTHYQFRKHALT